LLKQNVFNPFAKIRCLTIVWNIYEVLDFLHIAVKLATAVH